MVIRVCRLMNDFPSLEEIERASEGSLGPEKIEYVQYGLAPGIYTLMKEQIRLGARFSVIALEREGVSNYEAVDGIEVFRVRRPYNITALKKVREVKERVGVDVVHAHATSAVSYALLRRLVKWRPYVVHVHGTTAGVLNAFEALSLPVPEQGVRSKLWRELSLFRERLMWRRADRLIAVSSNVGKELDQFYDIPRDRIRVVYNGVDVDVFRPASTLAKQRIRRSLGIKGKPVMLYVGYFGSRKGLKYLLKAVPKVVESFPKTVFVLLGGVPDFAGDSNYLRDLEELVMKRGIDKNVLFAGEVRHRDTLKFYAAADAFAFPTLYEGLAKALLEAMACGLPVVATKAGGNPDAVIHGETGLLAEPADSDQLAEASIQLLSNPSQAKEMGTKGRERVKEHFTWEATAKKIMAVYEGLLT